MSLQQEMPVLESADGEPAGESLITIQAEQVAERNNPNIRMAADYNTALTPYSGGKKVINYVEDMSYRYPGDSMTWRFTAEQEGCYHLALRLRQAELANFIVFRTVLIDGCIPGPDFETVGFAYAQNFENQIIMDAKGRPASVYLSAGEHTLSLITSVDPFSYLYTQISRIYQ